MSKSKRSMGRPSKYNSEIQKKADLYINECTLYKEINGNLLPNSIPSVAGLALELDITRETVYQWEKIYPNFSDTLRKLRLKQETFLIHHGLTKGYDSGFAKFAATNFTGMKERQEVESNNQINISIDKDDIKL